MTTPDKAKNKKKNFAVFADFANEERDLRFKH